MCPGLIQVQVQGPQKVARPDLDQTMDSLATSNNTTLTSQPHHLIKTAPPQHKKRPKWWYEPLFGSRYACYECLITMMATNYHHRWQTEAQAPMHVFPIFSILTWFFYYTNCNITSMFQDGTQEHKKRPKQWYILSFGHLGMVFWDKKHVLLYPGLKTMQTYLEPKIGSVRNQHPYVSCLVSTKPGKIWPSKNPKSFFPSFFLQNFVKHTLILIYNLYLVEFLPQICKNTCVMSIHLTLLDHQHCLVMLLEAPL